LITYGKDVYRQLIKEGQGLLFLSLSDTSPEDAIEFAPVDSGKEGFFTSGGRFYKTLGITKHPFLKSKTFLVAVSSGNDR
jgi:hypothetical protein